MNLVQKSSSVVVLAVAILIAGCGGGGDETSTEPSSTTSSTITTSTSSTESTSTTSTSAASTDPLADEGKFASCVLYKNGNDSTVTNVGKPDQETLVLAGRYKASYLVALRNDDGFFQVFQPKDPRQLPNLVDELPSVLDKESEKLKGMAPASAQVVGPLAVGFQPYASAGDQVISDEVPAIEKCISQNA